MRKAGRNTAALGYLSAGQNDDKLPSTHWENMQARCTILPLLGLALTNLATLAAVRYVDVNSANPTPPYTNWATAATTIQAAVDVSTNGDLILVTNGVYRTGGRSLGSLTNRVAITNALTIRSVNGPAMTLIEGTQVPQVINDFAAARCVHLAAGATLSGFTLTNGATGPGGSDGEWESTGGAVICESTASVVTNCVLLNNSAGDFGGAVDGGTLNNCALLNNSAGEYSGGAIGSTLNNCVLSGNSAGTGGGAAFCTLNGGTVTGNTAVNGGGADESTLNNCIVYFNHALNGDNYTSSTLNYCCTTPLPDSGTNNLTADPQLASISHLSSGSPCRGTGNATFSFGTDIDGEAWATPPSIGCDEYNPGAVTGPLAVALQASYTNVATGFEVSFTANITGRCSASRWDFGDGTVVSNQPYASHHWMAGGDYPVTLWADNESNPGGTGATVVITVTAQPVCYVSLSSTNPVPPYSSWVTAATNINDAVDAAIIGGTVLVSNGVYQTGVRVVYPAMTNRVAVTKPVTVQSLNGLGLTMILGDTSTRCVYLVGRAALVGFTVTNGWAVGGSGGGAWCQSGEALVSNCYFVSNSALFGAGISGGTVSHCVLRGNGSTDYGATGGGASGSTMDNCVIYENFADYGGGFDSGTLNNCTLVNNTAGIYGGAADYSALNNCIIYYGGDTFDCGLNNCCADSTDSRSGFFTLAPQFVDLAGGDFHLRTNSPCINAGRNAYATNSTDLDGNPRIAGGTVDIGAYEFQSPASLISYAWLQQYGLPTDGSADFADPDGDGMNNWQEWRAGTNPTNALSALRMLSAGSDPAGVAVNWQSVGGISYFVQRSTNLAAQPAFSILQSNIASQGDTTTWVDTNATGSASFIYRVGVQ